MLNLISLASKGCQIHCRRQWRIRHFYWDQIFKKEKDPKGDVKTKRFAYVCDPTRMHGKT